LNCESNPLEIAITLKALAALHALDPAEFDARTWNVCAPSARAVAGVAEHGEVLAQPAAVAE
jgi:hypothetical protein